MTCSKHPDVQPVVICPACAGSTGGKATTPAKRQASAANGKKGGRPRKPLLPWQLNFAADAAAHKACDEEHGRPWQCACAACIQVREGITKSEWLKRQRKK